MAISYYTGVPRTGKSYKAVYLLYKTFIEEKKQSITDKLLNKEIKEEPYINAYTNINGFNFEVCDRIKPLDFESFKDNLHILYSMYMDKKSDFELIEKAKELEIYKSLIVIDEVHNFFNKKDDAVLVWWLTYHAHIHHELIFITQDLSLIGNEYKRVAEFFYKAVPQRFRLNPNTFIYTQFSSYSMYQNQYISKEKIPTNQKVFDLYVSGKHTKQFPLIYKYFALIFVAFLYLLYAITTNTLFSSDKSKEEIKENQNLTQGVQNENISENISQNGSIQNHYENVSEKDSDENLKLFKFDCYSNFCYYSINNSIIEVPQNILKSYLLNIDEDKKYLDLKNNRLLIYVLLNESKFNFLTKGVKNEDENKNTNFSILDK
jgi:zona occludens toxin